MASDGTLKFDTSLDTGGLQSGMGKVASVAQQALGVFTGQMMTRAVDALANLGKSALDSVGQLTRSSRRRIVPTKRRACPPTTT